MSVIGENIKMLREEIGMTQDELAKEAGYRNSAVIVAIENGNKTPSYKKNRDIANALGCNIKDLFKKGEEKEYKSSERNNKTKLLDALNPIIDSLTDQDIARLVSAAYLMKAEPELTDEDLQAKIKDYKSRSKDCVDEQKGIVTIQLSCKNGRALGYAYDGKDTVYKTEATAKNGESQQELEINVLSDILENAAFKLPFQKINIHTDLSYIEKAINYWLKAWEDAGWKKKDGGEIAHLDFWKIIASLRKEVSLAAFLQV